MNDFLAIVFLSFAPISELRGGIPFALSQGFSPFSAFFICVFVNVLVYPVVFFFLEFIHFRFLHLKYYRSAFDYWMEKTRKKVHPFVERYGFLGLALFVAVPLPLTGVYTATFAAWFFGMSRFKGFLSVAIGALIAGIIVLSISLGSMSILS